MEMEEKENWADSLQKLLHELSVEIREALAAELESQLAPLIKQRGETVAKVKSAIPLTREEQIALKEGLKKRFGEDFFLDLEVDPSLIGGLVIEVKEMVMDFSVAGKLEALREHLLSFGEERES